MGFVKRKKPSPCKGAMLASGKRPSPTEPKARQVARRSRDG